MVRRSCFIMTEGMVLLGVIVPLFRSINHRPTESSRASNVTNSYIELMARPDAFSEGVRFGPAPGPDALRACHCTSTLPKAE